MPQIVSLDAKTKFAFDLVWARLSNGSAAALLEAGYDAQSAVRMNISETEYFAGYYIAQNPDEKPQKNLISFGALMAKTFGGEFVSSLVFVSFGEGMCGMVGLRNGSPVPYFDRYGREDDIVALATEFVSMNQDAVLISNVPVPLMVSDTRPFDLSDILLDKDIKKTLAACSLKPLVSNNRQSFMIVMFLLVLAFVGFDRYNEYRIKEEAAKTSTAVEPPEVTYENGWKKTAEEKGMSAKAASALMDKVSSLQLDVAGWTVSDISCEASGQCKFTWHRKDHYATLGELSKALGSQSVLPYTSPDTVEQNVKLETSQMSLDKKVLPSTAEAMALVDELFLPFPKFMNSTKPSSPMPVNGVTVPAAVGFGNGTVSGPLWMSEIMEGLPSWMGISSFKMSGLSKEAPSLSIEYVYFSK